jgi:hypothetical protein
MTAKGETARQNYIAAREEILLRMKLRDQVLLFYLAALGTLLGFALGSSSNPEILFAIPFLAAGASIIVSQHNAVMAVIGEFCADELEKFLRELDPPENAPQWDNSYTYKRFSERSTNLRSVSHIIILLIPCVLTLVINWKHINSPFPYSLLWYLGAGCIFFSLYVILSSHKKRSKVYDERHWRKGQPY